MIEKIRAFIRYGHVYTKAAYIAAIAVTIIFGLGLILLIPHANTTSIQAGLTVIAGILGVLLGVVLVIVGMLVPQEQQSDAFLRGVYPKYYELIRSHLEQVNSGRKQLADLINSKKIKLGDLIFPPLATKYRDVLGCFISLSIIFDLIDVDESEKILGQLGYKQGEIGDVVFGQVVLGEHDPVVFLNLVRGAFNILCVALLGNEGVSDLSGRILVDYNREGITDALKRLEMSRKFLRSKILAFSIALFAATTMGAVLVLFGTTDATITDPAFSGVVIAVVSGFYLSILLALFLMNKMFV